MQILEIQNDGQAILATNYWNTPAAKAGKFLVSVNAGAFRVLVPDAARDDVARELAGWPLIDRRVPKGCAVSRGPWPAQGVPDAFEFLWDDGTSQPYALHLAALAFDRVPAPGDVGETFVLSVWVRGRSGIPERIFAGPCRYRTAPALPDLRPWTEG